MKHSLFRRIGILCLLLCALFSLGALSAGAEAPYYHFHTVSELKELLALREEQLWAIDESDEDHVITEDLTIPRMNMVFFGKGTVTIPEGVTVTIENGGTLSFHNMDLKGTINNRGDLRQAEPEEGETGEMRISGSLNNSGWFIYYNASGLENAKNSKGYTVDRKEEPLQKPEPAPELTPEPTSKPDPKPTPGLTPESLKRAADLNLRHLQQRLIMAYYRLKMDLLRNRGNIRFWLPAGVCILFLLFVLPPVLGRGKKPKKEQIRNTPRPQPETKRTAGTNPLSEDQRRRIDRLDDWLRDGLIDREEYKRLKNRYRSGQ